MTAETGIQLRSPNWKSTKFTAPSGGLTRGQMYKQGSLVGLIEETVAKDEVAVLIYAAEKVVCPKVAGTGISFAVGDKVYFKPTTNALTNATTSNTLCGRCLVAASASDTTVEIELTGNVVA